jgi:hypothetical protein
MLVMRGLATPSQIEAALEFQRTQSGRLGAILIAAGVLSSTQLLKLLEQQREIRATLPFYQQILKRTEQELGPAHESTARARCSLARILLADGRPEEARPLIEQAHETNTLIYGANHRWTQRSAEVLEACALALKHRNTYELARLRALEPAGGK